jgi:hypothetical protein
MHVDLDPAASLRVVTSYAHTDKDWLAKFDKFWKPLRESQGIASWTDHGIIAGQSWDDVIKTVFKSADIFIFLLSADTLASEYINSVELKIALERRAAGHSEIVPVILRPCLWEETVFQNMQVLPTSAKPVTTWSNKDEAFLDVANGLKKVFENFQKYK